MKKSILLVLLFKISFLQAQIVNIPDINFKNALLNHVPIIDTNADGEIQVSEAEAFTNNIIVQSKNISDLTGIEAFRNITAIDCRYNNLTELDCSSLTNLSNLDCCFNSISSLSFPNTIGYLFCSGNNLESLDVSNHTSLYELFCADNPNLIEINVNGCNLLFQLNFENNPNITSIDLSNTPNLHQLEIPQNGLTSLDVSHLPYLIALYCGSNQLETIDLSNNPNLMILTIEHNNLTELDISNNLLIRDLWFNGNNISSIDLSDHLSLERLRCEGNDLTYLDIRNGNNTNIYGFDAQNNPDLTCIYVDDALYSTENWTYVDENSTFVETEAECDALGLDIQQITGISIYPNPVKDILYIEFDNVIEEKSITIFNSLGKLVYSKKTKANKIDLSKLGNGIYSLIIEINKRKTNKLIVKI